MYMLVKFEDGSNPWYSINPTKEQAIKRADYFINKHDCKTYIFFGAAGTDTEVLQNGNGEWIVRHDNKGKTYKRLGDALNFLIKEEARVWS